MGNVTKKPCIFAGDLSPEELRNWLNQIADSAGVHSDGINSLVYAAQSLQAEAGLVGSNFLKKIAFLSDPEIIRSEDHSIAIQEDLRLLREIERSIHDFHQAILPSLSLLSENQAKKTLQERKGDDQATSGPVTQEVDLGRAG
ncbi:hypothetical protein [Yersinia ruckeri]|uniref:hypothetical protein n=1 Tax=Yersinia ruckeri TaxID=29486 RepID=UPI001F2E0FEE|nr:hypothetical protein [Yersinia ruckeri]UIM99586.1 hypothetical protein LGL91_10385 [Yersinia ruckeri]